MRLPENDQYSILIVDDTPKNIQVLGTVLSKEGYGIEFATNGDQALKWIGKKSFDLIILDIMMPGIDGFQVCKQIRSNKALDNVPIIFLTAKVDKEDILKGFEQGGQDYITKPFDARELNARVRTHLELKASKDLLKKSNEILEEKVKERTLELEKLNEVLKRTNEQLINLDEAKQDFLRIISHEIRTPLNGIKGFTDLLKLKNTSENLTTYLNMLDDSVKRLNDFAILALDITRLKTKKYTIEPAEINLFHLIDGTLVNNEENIKQKNIAIDNQIAPNGLNVKGDLNLMKRAFTIMIENAITHTKKNGNVEISAEDSDKDITLTIKDDGQGFKKEFLEQGFKLFITGKEHFDRNTGLNLPFVHLIAEAHNGALSLSNVENGRGAIIKFKIPK